MTEFFLKQLRPLLCYCNLFSITYIVFAKTKSLFLHRAELFMGAPITLFYAFCVYAYTIELMAGKALRLSLISKIADPLEFIAFVFNLIIKWTYYFFKRNETRQVVFEVGHFHEYCLNMLCYDFIYVLGSKTANNQYVQSNLFARKSMYFFINWL